MIDEELASALIRAADQVAQRTTIGTPVAAATLAALIVPGLVIEIVAESEAQAVRVRHEVQSYAEGVGLQERRAPHVTYPGGPLIKGLVDLRIVWRVG